MGAGRVPATVRAGVGTLSLCRSQGSGTFYPHYHTDGRRLSAEAVVRQNFQREAFALKIQIFSDLHCDAAPIKDIAILPEATR